MDEPTAERIATALESIDKQLGRLVADAAELRSFGEEIRPHLSGFFARARTLLEENQHKFALAAMLAKGKKTR